MKLIPRTLNRLALSAIILLAQPALASTRKVSCESEHLGERHTIQLKIENGRIVAWNSKVWANILPKKSSVFFWFGEDRKESGIESESTFKTPNGYTVLKLGTTADEVSVGVSLSSTKGFYSYRDTGSGNGNLKLVLECEDLR